MKEQIKEKLKERMNYILSKDARDITDGEYDVLIDKLDKLNNLEYQNSNSNDWLIIVFLMFLFAAPSKSVESDEEDVRK